LRGSNQYTVCYTSLALALPKVLNTEIYFL